MDKKALAGIGIIAVGGIAVIMMSRSGSGASMPGVGGGGGAPPPETKKGAAAGPTIIYDINFGSPGGFGGFGGSSFPDPLSTIADTLYPGDPAGHVYASTLLSGYHPPAGPTKKEQKSAEHGFTSRTGGGEDERWIGGR